MRFIHVKDIPGYFLPSALFISILFFFTLPAFAQKNIHHQDPNILLEKAGKLYQKGLYANAQPLYEEYLGHLEAQIPSDNQINIDNAHFYSLVCAINLDQPHAISKAEKFINNSVSLANKQKMSYQIAHYYFKKENYQKAITYFEQAGIDNFSNEEIANKKFEQAYAYFNLQEFDKALPLFNAVKNVHNEHFIPANYYTGYISLLSGKYKNALASFQKIINEPQYDKVVPYYIAEIYYYQDQFDKLLRFAQPYLEKGNLYYDKDLRHLLGQTYFEKKEYKKALPYLEEYGQQAETLQKEDVYELAYCYYKTGKLNEAIAGFKQLSGGTDSLAQNSMYILGDCYLKTGQKSQARHAFAFCARSSYNAKQQEVSKFNYGKLSYELGYQDAALKTLQAFIQDYPQSDYNQESREILAHLFMNTEDYKDALVVLKDIPKQKTSVQKAYQRITFGRAMQLINDEQLDMANQLLDQSLQYRIDDRIVLLTYFWKGEIALRKGQYTQAISNTQRYISSENNLHPGSGEANIQSAHYNIGYSYLQKGQYSNALPHFKKAQHTFGSNGTSIANDARLREADCYYMLREYNKASNIYNQAVEAGGAGRDYALYQKAIIAGIQGDRRTKVKILRKIPQYNPNSSYNGKANYQLGLAYMNQGKYNAAISSFRKIASQENNADAPKAILKIGLAYASLQQKEQAAQEYKKLVQKYPNSAQANEALTSLKNIYITEGQPQQYFNYLNAIGRKLDVSKEDSLTYAVAESSFANQEYNKAVSQFSTYLSDYPTGQFTAKAHFYRAESAYKQEDYTQALKDYESVIKNGLMAFKEHSAARAAYINYYKKQNYTAALNDYKSLKTFSTNKENTLTALRGILKSSYKLEQWDQVKTSAQKLLQQEDISTGDQIVSYFYLGRASQEQTDYATAIQQFQQVASMTTSELGAESRYYIALCKLKQDKLKEAEKAAFEVIKKTPSYDFWVAKSYLLLGNIFWQEKDYFNAKATLQSIIDHSDEEDLVNDAKQLLEQVKADNDKQSKINYSSPQTDTNNTDSTARQ